MSDTPDQENEHHLPFFTCHACGSHVVRYEQEFEQVEEALHELPCTCGDEETAAVRTHTVRRLMEAQGFVHEDRSPVQVECSAGDVIDESTEDDVACERCFKRYGARGERWVAGEPSIDVDPDRELTLYCEGCDREVEFGYSHPNKVGRLWLEGPDDRDANPWRTFPDPKYVESWRAKGWLRPEQ